MILKSRNHTQIFIFFIIIFAFIVRFINLTGDAPAGDISRSGVFYVDEGTYAHNAVNKALFGEWFLQDDYNPISNVPIYSLFQFVILKIFGVSLKSIRYGGIFFFLFSLLLFWFFLKPFDRRAALIAIVLGASSYFFIIYNRIALLENLLVLFLSIVTAFLFLYHQKNKLIWLILATLFFVAGYFVKATIIFYSPLFLVAIFFSSNPLKPKLRHFSIFLLTAAMLAIISYFVWILPHQSDWIYFQNLNLFAKVTLSPIQILTNYGRYIFNLKLFQFMPVTYTLFLFSIGAILLNLVKGKKVTFAEAFFVTWAMSVFLFLGFFAYSPPRFSLILMPAIFCLVGLFLSKCLHGEYSLALKQNNILLTAIFLITGLQIWFGFFRIVRDGHFYLSCFLPLFSLPALFLLYLIPKNPGSQKIIFFMLIAILFLNIFQVGQYHFSMQHSYYNAIKSIEEAIRQAPEKEQVLAGDIAPLVATELNIKAVNIIFREETEQVRFLNQRPRFLILQDKNEMNRLQQKMPDYLNRVQLLKTYRIFENYVKNDDTYFYKIN